ncbi:hypothetical protein DES35_10330 [Schleiferia thermophila]|jgi:hypothetical protein|uniref:Uncharacterized protein n=1 Tax=Schleiferia thermophila TaxID=884107 RepID=A0A369A1H0_9FLAO|nr:hypothetical protein DES35_10330 [Schleiferia thermophila]
MADNHGFQLCNNAHECISKIMTRSMDQHGAPFNTAIEVMSS